MKTLIVYFSYTVGNTQSIAVKLQNALGATLVRLQPVTPYSTNYDEVVSQAQREVPMGIKPAIQPLEVDLSQFDRIIVGSPTWWYTMAPVVLSFLSSHNFSGKTVIPFMTNAGWPGTVLKDMLAVAKAHGAKVLPGHAFQFSSSPAHFSQMESPVHELDVWIDSLK